MKTNNSELPSHLVKVDTDTFDIMRKKHGEGYKYVHMGSKMPINAGKEKEMLTAIAVPNTWTDVKLTLNPKAYIQATGYDGSGKLQYLYHEDYLEHRNQLKFAELGNFGKTLPRIRRRIKRDLDREGWDKNKLLALMVRILDKYHLRVGSRVYAKKNQSFGLTTLRKKHLKEEDSDIHFEYIGKSSQDRKITLSDQSIVDLIREVAEFPGWELFSIKHEGETIKATSSDINEYIRSASRSDFTARTFRTWAGTVLAVKNYPKAKKVTEENSRRELPAVLTELVAEHLGNTPSICRSYYIHPGVFEKVINDDFNPEPCDQKFLKNTLYRRHECRTMEILSEL